MYVSLLVSEQITGDADSGAWLFQSAANSCPFFYSTVRLVCPRWKLVSALRSVWVMCCCLPFQEIEKLRAEIDNARELQAQRDSLTQKLQVSKRVERVVSSWIWNYLRGMEVDRSDFPWHNNGTASPNPATVLWPLYKYSVQTQWALLSCRGKTPLKKNKMWRPALSAGEEEYPPKEWGGGIFIKWEHALDVTKHGCCSCRERNHIWG